MVKLNFKGAICSKETKAYLEAQGDLSPVITFDMVENFFNDNPDEPIQIDIDSPGGDVLEGFRIYDLIRMSEREVYTNIVGTCDSMATVILLSAPEENRSANRNSRSLIHQVSIEVSGRFTSGELKRISAESATEEAAILDVYVERTGMDREALQTAIKEEQNRDAKYLLSMNFISKINGYNTNLKIMEKPKSAYSMLMEKIKACVGTPKNEVYEYKDMEGNVLFTAMVPVEELAVGTEVTLTNGEASGKFILEDGREVEIVNNIVEEISMPSVDTPLEERVATLEALIQEATNLATAQNEEIENLKSTVAERDTEITNLKAAMTGGVHTPSNVRQTVVTKPKTNATPSVSDLKEIARVNREKVTNAKKLTK